MLIGASGQLGSDLALRLGLGLIAVTHEQLEITNADQIQQALDRWQPTAVINTAAYNLVDQAEKEPDRAFAVNADGPELLARACQERNIVLMQISTDYVFGADRSRNSPYSEEDLPGPVGVYGQSKLAGEQRVLELCQKHFVMRTCGLYGRAATKAKGNFVNTMLRLGSTKSELKVVADQHCTPTYTADLAEALVSLLKTEAYGLYHATNSGATSWCELAREIFRLRGLATKVIPITTTEYGAPAQRPLYSVLNCNKLATLLGSPLRPWTAALTDYLKDS